MEICQKCGGTKYTDALKEYNAGKPAWCLPRKGTELHAEVLRIMNAPKKSSRKLRKAPAPTPAPTPAPATSQKKRIIKAIDPEIKALMDKPKKSLGPSEETVSELESVFNGSSLTFKLRASGAYFLTMKDGQGKTVVEDGQPGSYAGEYYIYAIEGYLRKYIIKIFLNEETKGVNIAVSKKMSGSIKLTDFEVNFE